jgi:hypothetical protein
LNRFLSTPISPVLLWLSAGLIATLSTTSSVGHILIATAAAACALLLPQPTLVRIATALAMLPTAFVDAPAWTYIVAGGLLASVLGRPARGGVPAPMEQIQRHLEWCRRRGEPGHLLWVHAPDIDRETATAALGSFRLTDSAALLHEADEQEEIVAMLDHASFEPGGLEQRLRAYVGEDAGFGWATFPEDGVTVEALFQHARMAAVASSSPKERPTAQLSASFRRWGGTAPARAAARSSNQG